MKDPERLLDGGDDLEISLLDALDEAPPDGLLPRTLVSLGIGAAAVATGAAATAATSAAAVASTVQAASAASAVPAAKAAALSGTVAIASASSGPAVAASAAGSAGLGTWIILGALGGLATFGALETGGVLPPMRSDAALSASATPRVPLDSTSRVHAPLPSEPLAPEAEAAPTPAQADVDAVKPTEGAAPAPVRPQDVAPPAPSSEVEDTAARAPSAVLSARPDLRSEVAALDAARQAVRAGDAARALALLDEHERGFPGGRLGPEASVLRVEALLARGDRASAVKLAERILRANPNGAYAGRIRALVPEADVAARGGLRTPVENP